jgi:hypothetical protein
LVADTQYPEVQDTTLFAIVVPVHGVTHELVFITYACVDEQFTAAQRYGVKNHAVVTTLIMLIMV